MNLTGSYPITITWKKPQGLKSSCIEVKEYNTRDEMLEAFKAYSRRIGKDVESVRPGDHSC